MHLGKIVAGGLVGAAMLAMGGTAQAAFIETITNNPPTNPGGNVCAGALKDCIYAGSPAIIKFEFDDDDDGTITITFEISPHFLPSIDGSEFAFFFSPGGTSGTWTYTPGPGDPIITHYAAKGGPASNVFRNDAPLNSGAWSTPNVGNKDNKGNKGNNGNPAGLSNFVFFDTHQQPPQNGIPIPEPASLALLGMGLVGLGWAVRRRAA